MPDYRDIYNVSAPYGGEPWNYDGGFGFYGPPKTASPSVGGRPDFTNDWQGWDSSGSGGGGFRSAAAGGGGPNLSPDTGQSSGIPGGGPGPSPWNNNVEIRRGVPVGARQFQTTGYSPIHKVDPKKGGGPVDMRGQPVRTLDDPTAPYTTVAGKKSLYPYGTSLVSPNFPGQQFSFRDTGRAAGIRSGQVLDIATGSRALMNSPFINQPSATFFQGQVGAPGQPAGTDATLATTSDLYGGQPQIQMGIGGLTSDQGPATNTPFNFGQPFNFDTSGSFGATDLPAAPGGAGDIGAPVDATGLTMPPMTSMPAVDPANMFASAGQLSGTLSTDNPQGAVQTPSITISGGGPQSGGTGFNYSPAPGGGYYVYDANWNYVSTVPGTDTSTTPAATTAASTPASDTSSPTPTPVSDVATPNLGVSNPNAGFASAGGGTSGNYFAAGGNSFGYGGPTSFGTASTGLFGGFEGGVNAGGPGGGGGAFTADALSGLGGVAYGFGPRIL